MAMEFAIKKLDSVIVIEITVDMTATVITILEALWGGINRAYPNISKFKKSRWFLSTSYFFQYRDYYQNTVCMYLQKETS